MRPWPTVTLTVECVVTPAPTRRASTTATRRPERRSNNAVVTPVMPAPTTTTSTSTSRAWVAPRSGVTRVSIHGDVCCPTGFVIARNCPRRRWSNATGHEAGGTLPPAPQRSGEAAQLHGVPGHQRQRGLAAEKDDNPHSDMARERDGDGPRYRKERPRSHQSACRVACAPDVH